MKNLTVVVKPSCPLGSEDRGVSLLLNCRSVSVRAETPLNPKCILTRFRMTSSSGPFRQNSHVWVRVQRLSHYYHNQSLSLYRVRGHLSRCRGKPEPVRCSW